MSALAIWFYLWGLWLPTPPKKHSEPSETEGT